MQYYNIHVPLVLTPKEMHKLHQDSRTLIPDMATVICTKEGRTRALSVEPSLTYSTIAETNSASVSVVIQNSCASEPRVNMHQNKASETRLLKHKQT